MSRTKKFLYNSLSTALLQIVTMIVGFIIPRIMLQYYGSEINGLVSSISQFIAYFNLVEAGLARSAIYALFKPLAEDDHQATNAVVSAAKKFYTLSGYIFTALTIGLAVVYPIFIKTNSLTPLNVGLLILVLGVSGTLEFFTMAKYRVLLTADQKLYVISLTSALAIIINTIIIVILSKMKVDIVVLRTVALLSVFARTIILHLYVTIKYKYINYKEKPNYSALDDRWDAMYLQILSSLHVGVPVVYATIFTDLKVVSIYSIYNMVIGGVNGVLSMFIAGLSSSFGEIIAKKDLKLFQKASSEFDFLYYSLLTVIYSVIFVIFNSFIKLYTRGVTDANYDLPITGFLFIINGLFYNLKTPQGMLISSAGLFKETKTATTIQASIIIIVGFIFIKLWGLNGVLIASILANLYRDIELMFFIPKTLTKLPVKNTMYRYLNIFALSAIICIPFFLIKFTANSYLELLIVALIAGVYAVIVVVVAALIFDKKQLQYFINRVNIIRGV